MAQEYFCKMHGGALDGQMLRLGDEMRELHLEDSSSGRLAMYLYRLDRVDSSGVRHYVVAGTSPSHQGLR